MITVGNLIESLKQHDPNIQVSIIVTYGKAASVHDPDRLIPCTLKDGTPYLEINVNTPSI